MANIREDLVGVVHTYVTGQSVYLRAGAPVPEGARVGDHVLPQAGAVESDDEVSGEEPEQVDDQGADAEPEDVPAEYPGDNASRAELDAYASALGIDPAEFRTKDDLIEAINQH